MFTKQALSLEDAKKIVAAAEAEAQRNQWPVVISIIDDGGHLVLLHRIDGTQLGSVDVAQAKARSALLFKRPTKMFEEAFKGGRQQIMTLKGAVPVEGGLPLLYQGQLVGAIGVSGVQSHQDGQVAQAGADALASGQ